MRERIFQATTLLSIALGLGLGFLLKFQIPLTPYYLLCIQTPGKIFLNMLQMMAVPLIVTSVIAGVTDLKHIMSKKMGFIAGAYFCGTTLIAIALGMILMMTTKPGELEDLSSNKEIDAPPFSIHLVLQDLLRNMIPENFFQAFYEQYKTEIVRVKGDQSVPYNSQNESQIKLIGTYVEGANMLGLIIWSFVIGIMLNIVGGQAKTAVKAIHGLNNAIKIIFSWFLCYLPIGVLFLVASQVLEIKQWNSIVKLGKLSGVFILGRNPYVIFTKISKPLITAFVLASSAATLPMTLECCEEKLKMNAKLCRLLLPIACTINMNGTALYEVFASVFVAQINDINLDIGQIISIALTVSVISFGASAIPQTGAMTTILVLTSVGLPAEDAYILLVVEWLLDHFATYLNVLGDFFALAVINHLCQDELEADVNESAEIIRDTENDLACLEPDELAELPSGEFIPSGASPAGSISPE
ncbi:excitatory amino acid transporter 3-like isoform X2 [Poeciliopsis prolifica]|uniref:excitatory amino acid transporter 3-like isoform X2 n=1 Tax=Poeciliopsis prolifica TaxID=188132 RepID=UPI002414511B|nr:excitatory amino acid transporter 3-like isoform X2 [Poeciliopsis prolifica]